MGAEAGAVDFGPLEKEYHATIKPLLRAYCYDCHSADTAKGEVDLESFVALEDVRREPRVWEKSLEMLHLQEMPPQKADQPEEAERATLERWITDLLAAEGRARAGDPGRVVLRRLNNVEYTRTVRDLTGVASLDPVKEFPIDGAAGEGFVNAGEALSMSPALLEKYFAAAQGLATHAVLLPDRFTFSAGDTRGDWVEEWLAEIRGLYARYATTEGGEKVDLQGIVFETNQGGRLPLEKYFGVLLAERAALRAGSASLAAVAATHELAEKYLASLWRLLEGDAPVSLLLEQVRTRWRHAISGDQPAVQEFVAWIHRWQDTLTRFQTVGHLRPWMVNQVPLAARQDVRVKLAPSGDEAATADDSGDLTLRLRAIGGGFPEPSTLVWEAPRLVRPGQPDLPLRDLRGVMRSLAERRVALGETAAAYLAAAAEAARVSPPPPSRADLAWRHKLDPALLAAWLGYLGLGENTDLQLDHFTQQIDAVSGYDTVKGWGSPDTPYVLANAGDAELRIPGHLKARGVVVHPSPTLSAAIGWQSPATGLFRIRAQVTHAHPECGNGVAWALELRRGVMLQRLASGRAQGPVPVAVGPLENVAVRQGDLVSLLIGPRDQNHSCDLTDVELTCTEMRGEAREWDLANDVAGDILAANPRPDRSGHADVWHFYTEPAGLRGAPGWEIPAGSVLARWQAATGAAEKSALHAEVTAVLGRASDDPASLPAPDAALRRQLRSLNGPFGAWLLAGAADAGAPDDGPRYGLDPALFGCAPDGTALEPTSLGVATPATLDIRLPREWAENAEFAATAVLAPTASSESGAQVWAGVVAETAEGAAVAEALALQPHSPIVVNDDSAARAMLEAAFADFRAWFPAAICYPKIVPVDELVTLTVFHREDDHLIRLLLDEAETARLNRLWDELRFIGQDAFTMVDSLEQLIEYATQDAAPAAFIPLREPVRERAAAFRRQLVESEPRHLDALAAFAGRAYRRPLHPGEADALRALYHRLRGEDLPHDEAFRLTLARVLVAPSFLYRGERPAAGKEPQPVSDWELASRLSYFLWSSMPDDALRAQAAAGRLHDPEVLRAEARRLLRDDRARALATEFACQWLHIRDFDTLDEKSEEAFPEFTALRGDMYEEAIRFFLDLFQNDGSVLGLLDADHTFLNETLASYYGIPGVAGPEWRRVEGIKRYGRGGVLGFATVLAKNSGASRTSPILRGNWVVETLLGDKLPKPPPNVPQLPESDLAGQLTMRQITELHTQVAECASCHQRIDPFGFALEAYDPIGRFREFDGAGRKIDTATRLTWKDDATFDGLPGLREYLLAQRRDEVVRTFCRKLLGYALGRGVQLSDGPLLDTMQAGLEQHGFRFSAALEPLLLSPQFLRQRGLDATREEEI